MRGRVVVAPLAGTPRLVAGVDCAFSADRLRIVACAVVWDRIEATVVETAFADRPLDAPYVPGYLSFREGPCVLDALGRLRAPWGLALFDAHGLAHPRRCGLATHVGVTLDRPAAGVAKSRLVGEHDVPGDRRGDAVPLLDAGEVIGRVLRTRAGVKPLYVSVGHRCDLDGACAAVLACLGRCRLPEPTRQADRLVAVEKRRLDAGRPGR